MSLLDFDDSIDLSTDEGLLLVSGLAVSALAMLASLLAAPPLNDMLLHVGIGIGLGSFLCYHLATTGWL